jgi:hypothetical protein
VIAAAARACGPFALSLAVEECEMRSVSASVIVRGVCAHPSFEAALPPRALLAAPGGVARRRRTESAKSAARSPRRRLPIAPTTQPPSRPLLRLNNPPIPPHTNTTPYHPSRTRKKKKHPLLRHPGLPQLPRLAMHSLAPLLVGSDAVAILRRRSNSSGGGSVAAAEARTPPGALSRRAVLSHSRPKPTPPIARPRQVAAAAVPAPRVGTWYLFGPCCDLP